MNYFALAGSIVLVILAINSALTIFRVALGKAHWKSNFAFFAQTAYVAGFGTLSVWLLRVAFA